MLYRVLHVSLTDGSGRQGVIRSIAAGDIATVEIGALPALSALIAKLAWAA